MTITDFLLERIAEDEAAANNATGARWVVLSGVNASLVNIDATHVRDEKWKYGRFGHIATASHDAAYAEHIARQDPARTLAECAAKRAIVGLHKVGADQCDEHNAMFESIACPTIRALAAVYKDHPDYKQEWA